MSCYHSAVPEDFKNPFKFKVSLTSWPTPQDYNEAVQNPQSSFTDPELKTGEPELTKLGLPRPITGMFASVYRMHCAARDWAVRCFLYDFKDQRERYELIEEYLNRLNLPYMVGFDHQEEGIKVHGSTYPMLKMEWCDGETLNNFVDNHIQESERLARLSESFKQVVVSLRDNGIAHGDLQHGNILVVGDELKLVDYDGMYIYPLSGFPPNELGHRNYQHPGRDDRFFGPELDNFSSWVIYLTLICLSRDPTLWRRLQGGDECLLFRQSDFADPNHSKVFQLLEKHSDEEIRRCSRLIRHLLSLPVDQVPPINQQVEVPADLPEVNPNARLPDWMSDGAVVEGPSTKPDRWPYINPKKRRFKKNAGVKQWLNQGQGQPAAGASQSYAASYPSFSPQQRQAALNAIYKPPPTPYTKPVKSFERELLGLLFPSLILTMCVAALLFSYASELRHVNAEPSITLSFNADGESNLLTSGNAYYNRSDYATAAKYYTQVLKAFGHRTGAVAAKNQAIAANNLGNISLIRGQYQEAQQYYTSAIFSWANVPTDQLPRDTSPLAITYANLGLAHKNAGEYEQAASAYRSALNLYGEQVKESGSSTATDSYMRICTRSYIEVLRKLGLNDDASRIEKTLNVIAPQSAQTGHSSTPTARSSGSPGQKTERRP